MRYVLIAGLLLALSRPTKAQLPKALSIGDTLPDITIGPVQNYPKQQLRLSELRGKVLLLDFWHGACFGCIEAFPKLEALQKKFGDQLQVIMVNFESQEQIEKTFNRWKRIHNYRFPLAPSVVGDTLLHRLFPHRFVPHEVWVDPKGVIRAFTSVTDVTETNIRAMLEGRPVRMDTKLDNLTFDDYKAPVLLQVYGENPGCLKYYNAILNFVPGLWGGLIRQIVDTASKTIRISRFNMSILDLFGNALDGGMGGNPLESSRFDFGKRVVLDVRDRNRYFYNPALGMTKGEWQAKNCYTYEAVLPLEQGEKIFTAMASDLERFFNVSCRIEKRMMKCFALVHLPGQGNFSQVSSRTIEYPKDTAYLQWHGMWTKWLVDNIARANRNTPFVFCDRTGMETRVDIRIKKSILSDIPRLKQELKRQCNLDLIETEQELEVLILKENP